MFKIDNELKSANIARTVRFTEPLFEKLNQTAQENNVSFNVILYNDGDYSNLDNPDDNILKELALNTNGRYFEVSKGEGILDACNSLYLDENMLDKSKTDDTDKDGLSDYDEIELGLDPNNADSKGDGIKDGERSLTYNRETDNLKITVKGKGNIASTVSEINSSWL